MSESRGPFDESNFMLPRDRREINAWALYYYTFNPLVSIWIDEITNQVYSDFTFYGPKLQVEIYEKEFWTKDRKFVFENESKDIIKSLNLYGEAIPYISTEEFKIFVLNPNYVGINSNYLSKEEVISLIADEELQRLVKSKKKEDKALVNMLDKSIVKRITSGKSITLHPNFTTYLSIKNSSYDIRGTGRLVKYFKLLMHEDKIREMLFEKNEKHEYTQLSEAFYRESISESFKHSLMHQRDMLEKWITEKLFKNFKITTETKRNVGINWTNEIDVKSIQKLWTK